ncbi:site-specific integrase [Neoroseomonas rubea]|uniref:site-specific integrase n=1 Tax=Neoroseomonas rubea TaxID=2748666 RepID=UPI0018DF92F6|nr:site-specific integrase [Roseomonas rubea]
MTRESTTPRAGHKALPLAAWPEADRSAWEVAVRPSGFLDPGGAAAIWRAASRRSALGVYGRWLAWLAAEGVDLAAEQPWERMTEERLRRYLDFLAPGRSPVTVASYIGVLWMVVRALFPDKGWAWLRLVHFHLRSQARPLRDKAVRLVSAQDGLQLGLDLIQAASARLEDPRPESSDARARVGAARDYRDGLIIALLALRPLRVKNLLGIEIGGHLRMSARRAALSFAGTETKTRKPIDHSWPPILLPHLERYLAAVRPILLTSTAPRNPVWSGQPTGAHLWVAQGGTALSEGGLRKALLRHTTQQFGRFINAHAFRMNVASTIARAAPGRIDMAQALLGHAKPTTTEAHYVLSDARLAVRSHHDLIASIRKSARRRRKVDRPRGL